MEIFAIVVVGVFLICSVVAIFFMVRNVRTLKRKDEIHFIGGADTERGYISYDNNFFKGTGNYNQETVLIGKSASLGSVSLIVNGTASITLPMYDDQVVIGRSGGQGIVAVSQDSMISKMHCRFYRYNGTVYLEDLNSVNHTFLNGSVITAATPVKSGDMIRIGRTELQITGL